MAKVLILKNTTASAINISGYVLPASGQIDASAINPSRLFNSTGLFSLIAGGTIIVNNGSIDLDAIDGARHVLTTAENTPFSSLYVNAAGQIVDEPFPQQHLVTVSEGTAANPTWRWPPFRVKKDDVAVVGGLGGPDTPFDRFNFNGLLDAQPNGVDANQVDISVADNPSLPGTGSVQLPSGTTAERPVSPVDGATRYNTDLDCIEVYSLVSTSWACVNTGADLVGSSFTLMFSGDGTLRNSWLDHGGNNIPTSNTFAVLPYDCVLSAMTYTNSKIDSAVTMEIYSAPENTLTQSLALSWVIVGRHGRRADFGNISFTAGTKVGIFARDNGNTPNDAIVNCFFQVTATNTGINIDNVDGVFIA